MINKTFWTRVVTGDVTKEQARDTGMALVLVLLLLALAFKQNVYVIAAVGVHVLNMTAPQLFRPAAVIWFGVSHLLGAIVSKVLLTLIFFVIVTPVGVWRRMVGIDSLRLKAFKAGRVSVMRVRNHTFTGRDIEQPY